MSRFLIRDSQLDKLEAAFRTCAAAEAPEEVTAADNAFKEAVKSSTAEEFNKFQTEIAPHIPFGDD